MSMDDEEEGIEEEDEEEGPVELQEYDLTCPECGGPLSTQVDTDKDTDEIFIEFYCEGAGDDRFSLIISTGLNDLALGSFKQVGKTIKKEMQIKLLERRKDPNQE
jgi:hypothetical protein